ncbi:hypothetical protein D4R87_02740 [bacterium]|nr:MAG: hypothetical protein D4R87_02740 [bacterium]
MKKNIKNLIAMFIISSLLLVPAVSFAAAGDVGESSGGASDVGESTVDYSNTLTFPSPIEDETVDALVASIADWLVGIVAGIAVIMIMVGGFMYVTSIGDPTKAKKGVEYIKNSVIGLAIILGADIIIDEIRYLTGAEGAGGGFSVFANTFIGWFLTIIIGVSVLMIMYAGFLFLTGGEDSNKIIQAKAMIKYTVIGIIVAILSASLINFVLGIF